MSGGGGPFERMDHAQLFQGFSDQTKVADAHFLVSVVELTPFLSISICYTCTFKQYNLDFEKVHESVLLHTSCFSIYTTCTV